MTAAVEPRNTKDISALANELESARQEYAKAQDEASTAQVRETNCLNRLNGAQREITEWYDRQHEDAPDNTDWTRDKL